MSKKAVVVKQEEQLPAVHETPTGLAGNITSADLRLPRIAMLQALSKSVQDGTPGHVNGVFVNTLTQDVLPQPITMTVAFIFKNVVKRLPKEQGGQIVYKTTNFTPEVVKDLQWNGSQKPTADLYINAVVLVEGSDMPLIASFSKTSLKTGQDLLTLVQLSGCAWKYQYELTSQKTTNEKGTFYVARIKRVGLADPTKAAEAAELYEQVKGMSIEVEGESEEVVTETGATPREF